MFYSYPKHKAIDCHIRMTFIQTLMHKLKKKTFNTSETCEYPAFKPGFCTNKNNSAGNPKV